MDLNDFKQALIISKGKFPSKIDYIADSFYDIIGYSKEELKNLSAYSLLKKSIYKDDFPSFYIKLNSSILDYAERFHFECRIINKQNKILDILLVIKLKYNDNGYFKEAKALILDPISDKLVNYENTLEINHQFIIKKAKYLLKSNSKDSVKEVLNFIQKVTNCDSTYVCLNYADKTDLRSRVAYYNVNKNIPEDKNLDLSYSKDGFKRWIEILKNNKYIYGYTKNFPTSEKTFFEKRNINYTITTSIYYKKRWIGFLSINFENKNTEFSKYLFKTIFKLSTLLSDYFYNKIIKIERDKHLRYQLALGKCSQIVLSHSKGATKKLLNVLQSVTNASFLAIEENNKDNTRFTITHQISKSGITFEQAVRDQSIYVYSGESYMHTGLKNSNVSISYTHLMSNKVTREFNERLNVKTIVLIPIHVDEKWFGNLSICFSDIVFINENDIENFQLIGNIIGTYYTKKHFREALEKSNKELEESLISKDQLFSIVSHDIKNPMNSILGFSTLISELIDEDFKEKANPVIDEIKEIEKYNNIITNSTEGLLMLLNNVLLWSSSIRNKITPSFEKVNLSKIYEETIKQISAMTTEKDITINIEGEKDTSLLLDKEMIILIIRNLLSNAIKFTNEHGNIKINTTSDKIETVIAISDNGLGMSKEKIDSIFYAKKIESNQGTNGEKGTGLGLIVCQQFTALLNGKISVESTLGVGTTFYLTFNSI